MQIINPRDEADWLRLRCFDITSTEVGALFGIDSASYIPTLFELWNRKQGRVVVDFEENERTKWGKRFEDSIANGVANDNNWTVRKMSEYIRDPELRIGASFDYSIEEIKDPISGAVIQREGCFEIKNVDSMQLKQKWVIDKDEETGEETIEAPLHIELQAQHQMLVSGRQFCYIAAMVGGNRVILIKRVPDLNVHAAIKQKAAEFWKSVEDNVPPAPNFGRDADVIGKLYGYAEVGKVIDASGDPVMDALLRDYREAQQSEKEAKERKEALKAQIIMSIGDAEKVIGQGWSVSAGMIAGAHIEYDRKPYRGFKPSFKKNFA